MPDGNFCMDCGLPEIYCECDEFNYDLDRIKSSVESGYFAIPEGLSAEQIHEFIMSKVRDE